MMDKYALVSALQTVLEHPLQAFSVRGLARQAKLSPVTCRDALQYMRKKGIVSRTVVGKTHQYRANLESPLCRQWKILFNVDRLTDSGVVAKLVERVGSVHAILLYGSFAKGTNDEKSDVDLLVVAHAPSKTDLGFANKLGREVNVSVFSLGEWRKKAIEDKVFYENVIFDSVVLYGERPVVA